MRADWRAISSSLSPSFTLCSFRHSHSQMMAEMQQKMMKARMIGEKTVRRAQTAHSTHPHQKVLWVLEVDTVLFPQPSILVVVISYSGISVYWLRQETAAHTCFCRRLSHTLQNPFKRLAKTRKRMTRAMQTRLIMAVAKNNSYPLIFYTPIAMKTPIPPRYPIMRHISHCLFSQNNI